MIEYFLSVDDAVEIFRKYFGPMVKVFAALEASGQRGLAGDLAQLFRDENQASDGTLAMPFEYLETILILN